MSFREDATIARTPVTDCPACAEGRAHMVEDWVLHPFARHGFTREQGWSHPKLAQEAMQK
jgi:hypothetical protein